jgi:hypothetical protein
MVLWFLVKYILKIFLISCSKFFKLIFLLSPAKNIENATIYFIQICPRFVSSLLFLLWIIIFETKLRKSIESLFYPELKMYLTETCRIGKPTHSPFKIYFIQLMIFFFDVPKFRLFSSFSKFLNGGWVGFNGPWLIKKNEFYLNLDTFDSKRAFFSVFLEDDL